MAFIFVGSTDAFSSGHTSRFIGPFLRWLSPGLPDAAVDVGGLLRFARRPT